MVEVWNTISTTFGAFDGITCAMMAIIVVGAAFMMPGMADIVTATFGAMIVFATAAFTRSVLAARDAPAVARADWNGLLSLQVRTLVVYGVAFGISIAAVHGLRMLSKT